MRQPESAIVTLTAPTAAHCPVTGLTVAGDYMYRFDAQTPQHISAEEFTVRVNPAGTW